MANKNDLKVGQRVRCFRTHDKFTPFNGAIVTIAKDSDLVTVQTEAGNGSVAQLVTASAADCTVLTEAAGAPKETASRPIGSAIVSNPIR